MNRLNKKVALITGGAKGLGASIAKHFYNENVNFGLRMKKENPVETAKKVDEWLNIVGLHIK